jgi:PEP-CTERM motif
MKEPSWLIAIVAAVLLLGGERSARGDLVLLPFDGLKHGEEVLQYYAGGAGSLGSGPGPNYGISFTSTAVVLLHGNYSGEPTPPAIMFLGIFDQPEGIPFVSTTMDVTPGFQGPLLFYYAALDAPGKVDVYSGLDGTGALLASQDLAVTSQTTGLFVSDQLSFSGTAHSVVFTGSNQQLAVDQLTLSIVPEPSTLWLAALGGSLILLRRGRRERRATVPIETS